MVIFQILFGYEYFNFLRLHLEKTLEEMSDFLNLDEIPCLNPILHTVKKNLRRSSAVASCMVVVKAYAEIITEIVQSVT